MTFDLDDTTVGPIGTSADVDLIWAIGSGDSIATHLDRGVNAVNFESGTVTELAVEGEGLRTAHGIFMVITWALLIPAGIFCARFLKHKDPLWFKLHQGIQSAGSLLGIAAFVIAIFGATSDHFSFGHAIIGLIVTILAVTQPIGAAFRPGKDASSRRTFNLLHWWFGRLAVLLAWINIMTGLNVNNTGTALYIVIAIWYVIVICAFVYGELKLKPLAAAKKTDAKSADVESATAVETANVESSSESMS